MAASLETGVLYRDDNLDRLAELPSDSVDLIYLDPPFFSNRVYEVIWGDEAEVRSFEDRWDGGIQHYIGWMQQRVVELHRVLKSTGSLYFHCDPHASHYLKVMLDDVFGLQNFRSEVIWKRTSAHNSAKRWGPVHDTILFYSRSDRFAWNKVFQPLPQETIDRWYNNVEPGTGRPYNRADLTASGVRAGESGGAWRGRNPSAKGRHWAIPRFVGSLVEGLTTSDALDALDAAGRIHWPKRADGMPMLKRYLDESRGIPAQDVVTDISPLNNVAAERLGYPTQKPEALIERFVAASSQPGDVVLDPFCGCGTTVAVAARLRREWIGIDISPTAIEIMKRRLIRIGVDPAIANAPENLADLKALKPFEFQNWVINAMNGTHSPRKVGDMGIDGFSFLTRDPIQVKQSERVGRPTVDSFQTAVRRHGSDSGYIVAFSFSRGAVEEVARARSEGLNIRLVRVPELLILLKRPGDRRVDIGPQPASVYELPLPPMRRPEDLPTAEELIESDRRARVS